MLRATGHRTSGSFATISGDRSIHSLALARTLRRSLIVGAATLLAWACGDSDSPTQPTEPVQIQSVAITAVETTALAKHLKVSLSTPAPIRVEYWAEGADRLRLDVPDEVMEHEVDIARLLPNVTYHYSVEALSPGASPHEGEFTAGSLPLALQQLTFTAEGRPSIPLVLFELMATDTDPAFSGLVMVDQDSRIVWYFKSDGQPNGLDRLANGDFVFTERFGGAGRRLRRISPLGQVVSDVAGPSGQDLVIHHDARVTDAGTVLVLTQDATLVVEDTTWTGDRIYEWDPVTNLFTERWNVFDFYSPADIRGPRTRPNDYSHANSLALGPRGNVVVSLQFLDQVISVSPDFQSVEWKLGGPQADYVLADDLVFSGQHSASEPSEGHVLLFDNGRERTDESRWSRGLEVELVPAGATRKSWEFRPQPDLWSQNISSVFTTSMGTHLLMYGSSSMETPHAFEVGEGGTVLWSVRAKGMRAVYRATEVESILGEKPVTGGS